MQNYNMSTIKDMVWCHIKNNLMRSPVKTIIDFKILRLFRKKGWTEKVTGYSIEVKKPLNFLKKEYQKYKICFNKHNDNLIGKIGLIG